MRYEVISADCHVDLCWLPPELFTENASPVLRDRIQAQVDREYAHDDRKVFISSGTSGGLVLAMLSFLGMAEWSLYGTNLLCMAVVPALFTAWLHEQVHARLPHNYFIYFFITTFLGAALAFNLAGLLHVGLIAASGTLDAGHVGPEYFAILPLMSFGEAVVNGDNVADWEGAQRMINSAIETFGDVHTLVNNAGLGASGRFAEITDLSIFDTLMRVNYLGGVWCARALLPAAGAVSVTVGAMLPPTLAWTPLAWPLLRQPGPDFSR